MRLLTLIVAGFMMGCWNSLALSEEVPPDITEAPPVAVTVTPVFDNPQYNYNVSIPSIQGLATQSQQTIKESLTLGLTVYKPFLQFSVPIKIWTNASTGVSCMHLEDATIDMGYHDVIVYIAEEIPFLSCGFNQIYDHEQKHIAVNQALLQEYTPLIQSNLQEYLNKFGVMCTKDPHQTKLKIDETFQSMLTQWSQQIKVENDRRQQLIDSPEEYERISRSCDGQLQELSRPYLPSP